MNKKGIVIGKTITGIIVTIATVLIMTVFVIMAAGISLIKQPEIEKSNVLSIGSNSLLLQTIAVGTGNGRQTMTVYDALRLQVSGAVERSDLKNALDELQAMTGKCYFLSYQSYSYRDTTGPYGEISDREVFKSDNLLPMQANTNEIALTLGTEKEYLIKYFQGKCP